MQTLPPNAGVRSMEWRIWVDWVIPSSAAITGSRVMVLMFFLVFNPWSPRSRCNSTFRARAIAYVPATV